MKSYRCIRHWLVHPWQDICRVVYTAPCIKVSGVMPLNEGFRLWAYRAQPYAPISSGRSLRNTVCPDIFSNALTTASFRIVPPCTTIQSPNDEKSFIFKTLCRQFFTTEYARPAAISPTEAPSRSTCLTLEFMNTVGFPDRKDCPPSRPVGQTRKLRALTCGKKFL